VGVGGQDGGEDSDGNASRGQIVVGGLLFRVAGLRPGVEAEEEGGGGRRGLSDLEKA